MKRNKTGGRNKGTPNKTTRELRNMLQSLVSCNLETMQKDFEAVNDPFKRLQIIEKLLRYVLPPMTTDENEQPETPEAITIRVIYPNNYTPMASNENEIDDIRTPAA